MISLATFAERFKYLREKKGWTQDQAAEKLGISRSTIAGYESEEKNRIPREETLMKIADYFATSTDYLLGRTDSHNNENIDIKDPDVQFIMRAKEEMSPKAYKKFMDLTRRTKAAFTDEDEEDSENDI